MRPITTTVAVPTRHAITLWAKNPVPPNTDATASTDENSGGCIALGSMRWWSSHVHGSEVAGELPPMVPPVPPVDEQVVPQVDAVGHQAQPLHDPQLEGAPHDAVALWPEDRRQQEEQRHEAVEEVAPQPLRRRERVG